MRGTHYEPGRFSPDLARWAALVAEDNSGELESVREKLARALREEVTPRQRQVLSLYYYDEMNLEEIGAQLGIDRSTVSRTLKRGEGRLRRCLRYGAPALLEAAPVRRSRRRRENFPQGL